MTASFWKMEQRAEKSDDCTFRKYRRSVSRIFSNYHSLTHDTDKAPARQRAIEIGEVRMARGKLKPANELYALAGFGEL